MIRYTIKMLEARAEGFIEGYKQGFVESFVEALKEAREQGREEVYRAWHADWEKRKVAAEAKGIPFDDPPPPNPNGHSDKKE